MKSLMLCRKVLFPVFVLAFAVLSAASAMAANQDEGLYDPVPPEGAAFIRFFHAQPDVSEVTPKVNGRERDGVKFGDVKPYGVAMNGKVNVELGDAKLEFDAEAKAHYTVILQNKVLRVVKDPEPQDALKAQIIVYNLTGRDDISLKTVDGKVSVIGPVKAGEVMDRAVNPIKVVFAIYSGDTKFADLVELPLERKSSYAIAVFENAGTGKASCERAVVSDE